MQVSTVHMLPPELGKPIERLQQNIFRIIASWWYYLLF